MLVVIFIVMGVLVVCGAVYLVMSSGMKGGRRAQSPQASVTAQRLNKGRDNSVRATGADD